MNARWVDHRALLALTIASCTLGCETTAFYGQAVAGHLSLMRARQPIEKVLSDPTTAAALRTQLADVRDILDFAHEHLRLDPGKSFRSYAAIDRDYVVWNIFAAPELAVEPLHWCYPLVGCASYRGFFKEANAQKAATRLSAKGFDTNVSGSPAYSSLGWFDDPILSTFITWNQSAVASLIFHELAHAKLFVRGDTRFNESFATFVERQGVRRWLANDPVQLARHERTWRESDRMRATVLAWRAQFKELYELPLPRFAARYLKAELFHAKATCLATHAGDVDISQLARFVAGDANNARFVPVSEYFEWVPAFARLFADAKQDWTSFYALALEAAHMKSAQRRDRFDSIAKAESVRGDAEASVEPIDCGAFSHRADE